MRRNFYNLVEMLVIIAILLIIFELVFQFFYDGSKLCKSAIERSFSNQEMTILSGKFRNFIHGSQDWRKDGDCLVSDWKIEGRDLVMSRKRMSVDGNRLIFEDPSGRKESRLDNNMRAGLSIEKTGMSADLAVLDIEIRGKNENIDRIRIVSCFQ